jgi:hypothetical protein
MLKHNEVRLISENQISISVISGKKNLQTNT